MIIRDCLRLSATINDHPRLFATVCDCRRSSATVCDGLRLSTSICDCLRLSATVDDHPRLVVVLPSSAERAAADWYTASQSSFLEGFEARFLCEYTGYWHVVDDAAFRFTAAAAAAAALTSSMTSSTGARRQRRPGDQLLAAVLRLALPVIQCLNAVDEHPENARLLAPVITQLIDSYELLVAVDGYHQVDPCAWLRRYKDRIVSVLAKVDCPLLY